MRAQRTMCWLLAGLCFAVGLLWFLLEHPAGPTRDFEGFDMPQAPLSMQESVYRRLLETQAAMIGLKLDIAWEVSSIASIIDLVCAGYGHAVLTASAVSASGRGGDLIARQLTSPSLTSVLCLAVSAHKRPGPLMRHSVRLLTELAANMPH